MATALVRDLDDAVYERLKARAAGNNPSLEAELREILEPASRQVDAATGHPPGIASVLPGDVTSAECGAPSPHRDR